MRYFLIAVLGLFFKAIASEIKITLNTAATEITLTVIILCYGVATSAASSVPANSFLIILLFYNSALLELNYYNRQFDFIQIYNAPLFEPSVSI